MTTCPRTVSRPAGALILVAALAAPAVAAPLTPRSAQERLEKLDEAAKAGRWSSVEAESTDLLRDLVESLSARGSADEPNRRALALALTLRALAESARGDERLAVWDWWLAQDLWPELRRFTLASYGPPAELLRRSLVPQETPQRSEPCDPAVETCHSEELDESVLRPPRRLSTPPPAYPRGARSERVEGTVVLQGVITTEGVIERPRVLESPAPSFTVAAAEVLRTWTFEPAWFAGQPVDAYYNLTVNFELVEKVGPQRPPWRRPGGS